MHVGAGAHGGRCNHGVRAHVAAAEILAREAVLIYIDLTNMSVYFLLNRR